MTSKESKPLLAWFTLAIENGASSASGLDSNRPLTSHVALCANNCHWLRGEIVIEPDNIFNLIMSRCAQNTFANFTQNFSPRLHHADATNQMRKAQPCVNDMYWYRVADMIQKQALNPCTTYLTSTESSMKSLPQSLLASFHAWLVVRSLDPHNCSSWRSCGLHRNRPLTSFTQVVKLDMSRYAQNNCH